MKTKKHTSSRTKGRFRRKNRIRKKVRGDQQKPRLSIFRSNRNIYAQIINDERGVTLVSASTMEKDFSGKSGNQEAAKQVGKILAERSKILKIKAVCFDRGGNHYHGRVKAVADGAREGGLVL